MKLDWLSHVCITSLGFSLSGVFGLTLQCQQFFCNLVKGHVKWYCEMKRIIIRKMDADIRKKFSYFYDIFSCYLSGAGRGIQGFALSVIASFSHIFVVQVLTGEWFGKLFKTWHQCEKGWDWFSGLYVYKYGSSGHLVFLVFKPCLGNKLKKGLTKCIQTSVHYDISERKAGIGFQVQVWINIAKVVVLDFQSSNFCLQNNSKTVWPILFNL